MGTSSIITKVFRFADAASSLTGLHQFSEAAEYGRGFWWLLGEQTALGKVLIAGAPKLFFSRDPADAVFELAFRVDALSNKDQVLLRFLHVFAGMITAIIGFGGFEESLDVFVDVC